MGLFAAMMTYLVSAALLVGGMVTAVALFLAKPSDSAVAQMPRPPLVRAADRQAAEALKAPVRPQSGAASPAPAAKQTAVPQTAAKPPQLKAAEQTKQLAGQPARKKKVAKSAPSPSAPPREEDSATLGYSPSEKPRKFVFPLDPDW